MSMGFKKKGVFIVSNEYGSSNPELDARLEGMSLMTAPAGENTDFYFIVSLEEGVPDMIFNGVSLYAWDSNKGDSITLSSEYYVPPLNQWNRYKKFGKNWNIYPNQLMKDILFPTKAFNGVRIKFTYHNVGVSDVDFSANLYNFVDQQSVDTMTLEQGYNW